MKNIFLVLCTITLLYSTTITGNIVNGDSLQKISNTLITMENDNGAILVQKFFNEEYAIDIAPGEYLLRAYYYVNGTVDYYNEYNVQVTQEPMSLDIVLIPYALIQMTPDKNPPPLVNQTSITQNGLPQISIEYGIGFVVLILIASIVSFFYFNKKKTVKVEEDKPMEMHELDDDCKKVLEIIKGNEGRMIQKELREIMNFSETKMSLVVAELEAGGRIKRIKKGRENILKLVNK